MTEYVIELLSETGKRRLKIGSYASIEDALRAFDVAENEHLYADIVLRQGKQIFEYKMRRRYVLGAAPGRH
jgi:hypothetical protein